jgi:flagellar protein FlbT
MNISLRRGEKLYLNGAVLRADRKVCIELMNDATFLLENHVMQAKDATTPMRQLYFVIQLMLMSPNDTASALEMCRSMLVSLGQIFNDPRAIQGLKTIAKHLDDKRTFDALKAVRELFPCEAEIMSQSATLANDRAA